MDIRQLKLEIESNILTNEQMIWKLEDESSWFIAKQYISIIAKNRGLEIKYIDSFQGLDQVGFFDSPYLYIYKVDELKEYSIIQNSIIVCKKTSKKADSYISIPKLEQWQFLDYIQPLVPGMNRNDLEWLMTQYEYTYGRETTIRYSRYLNDIKKISIFKPEVQSSIFEQLYNDGEYLYVSNLTIFDLSNAIMKRDAKTALEVLKVKDYIDFEPQILLLSILLNNFKLVIDIQLQPKNTAESLGISEKRFYAIKKNNCGVYTDKELIEIYAFLTNLEYMYKFGELSTSNLTDRILCKIFGGV